MAVKPLDNLKVRQAIYHAIDRQSIAEVVMGGLADPAYSELAPPYLGHTKNVPTYDFNPTKAKQLLAEAGFPNGFETTTYWLNTINKEILVTIQANLKDVGINLKANVVDVAGWLGAGMEVPMNLFSGARSDPNVYYSTFFHSKGGANRTTYSGADDLIVQGRLEMDPVKRAAIYAQVQKQVMTDLPVLPLYYLKQPHPHWDHVKGFGARHLFDAFLFPVSIQK